MRLDFNVLWVEDQPGYVKAQVESIARQMQEEGFNFNPTFCRSPGELEQWIADDVFTDEIDLILVDWDLGSDVEGQDVIEVIREKVPYKDVVFYSAQTSAATLRKLAFEKGIEGIYCASRLDLVEEVLGVFDSLVKKVLDLDHTRGIVMGATSDIEHMVDECLISIQALRNQENQQAMLKSVREYVARRIEESTKILKKLENATDIAVFLEAHLLQAFDRLSILSKALAADDLEQHKAYRGMVIEYQQKGARGRNILGHQVLIPEGSPRIAIDASGKTVTLDEMRELRKLIMVLHRDFKSLREALKAEGAPVSASNDTTSTK